MNAAEAKRASAANASRMERDKKVKAEKDRLARIRNEKLRRQKFYKEHLEMCRNVIEYRVADGEHSGKLHCFGSFDSGPAGLIENVIDKHAYSDLLKKIFRVLKKEGYTITTGVDERSHTTSNESSVPDSTYWTYAPYIGISWK